MLTENIGAEFLPRHLAAGRLFNVPATLGRNAPRFPLGDSHGAYADRFSQCSLAPEYFRCFFDCVHGRDIYTAFIPSVNPLFMPVVYSAFMNDTPFARIEAERAKRKQSKRAFAEFLGVTAQVYNNWGNRVVPQDQGQRIVGKLRWSLDYLWLGKQESDSSPRFKEAILQHIDDIAARLPDAARTDLLKFAEYLEWRDAPKKLGRKGKTIIGERKFETERA